MNRQPWGPIIFTEKLREVGESAYHDKHPFHLMMNSGKLSREAIRVWVANRFYYQANIPIKDAVIISHCPSREVRRLWLHRIVDHDGVQGDEGGIGAWLRLGEACGFCREALLSQRHAIPAVRFTVDAYLKLARTQPWPIAVAASLTELFAPDLMSQRLEAFELFYPWIDPAGLDYFRTRIRQARQDSGEALALAIAHCVSREMQEQAVRALRLKCGLLWAMLDAIQTAAPIPNDSPHDNERHQIIRSPARERD
jgi:pyrroloquinoline-quinone synthase